MATEFFNRSGSLGVADVESDGLSGRFSAEMETLFVLITDRRGLGDDHPERHSHDRESRYDESCD